MPPFYLWSLRNETSVGKTECHLCGQEEIIAAVTPTGSDCEPQGRMKSGGLEGAQGTTESYTISLLEGMGVPAGGLG